MSEDDPKTGQGLGCLFLSAIEVVCDFFFCNWSNLY